jgi:DNA-binding MarR family transcriptional regulator
MPERLSAEELESVADLRIAIRRFLAASDKVTHAQGLTPRQYDLLALLHRPSTRTQTATDIATQLCLSRSATTELVTRASTAGLITRTGDSDDMRIKHLKATSEGSKRFIRAAKDLRAEREQLLRLLRTAAALAATLASVIS